MRLCVIDFETANQHMASACAIGVLVIEDGMVVEEYATLIQPHPAYDHFDQFNIQIHHITPDMVKDAPTFASIYPDLLLRMDDCILMAHNAAFDMAVLRSLIHTYGLKKPKVTYVDSLEVARRCFPQLRNHKLNTVCDHLDISLNHHDALSDARGSALIALNTMALLEEFDTEHWISALQLKQLVL